jgi:hypothetical protein
MQLFARMAEAGAGNDNDKQMGFNGRKRTQRSQSQIYCAEMQWVVPLNRCRRPTFLEGCLSVEPL